MKTRCNASLSQKRHNRHRIPAQPAQPEFQLLWIHEVLDHAERAAVAQPPLDDLIPARDIGLFPTFIDVLVDEQHPSVPGQQVPQQLPELPEPARRHMREPREKKITSNRVPGSQENTSATSKLTLAGRTRSRAIATISGAASIAVTVSAPPRQRLGPQASPARDLQHASGRISATSRAISARAAATSPYAVTSYSPARRR